MEYRAIFIAGPQGSGKGTQGKKLADKLGFLFWGMGGILRDMESDLQFAARISMLDKGTLLPDEIIIEILQKRLEDIPKDKGIVFDGVPRRVAQAEFLIGYLRERGCKNIATVLLSLPRQESIKRLVSRAEKEGRADDTPEAIERRFEYYDEMMPPLIEYLKKTTNFFEVDGSVSVEGVERSINDALGI